jgi:hypothetical protein
MATPTGTRIKVVLTEPLLGTLSGNSEVAKEFILSKCPREGFAQDEVEAQPDATEELDNGSTLFARNEAGLPILWDYHVKGFFKDACQMLKRSGGDVGKMSRLLKAHKKVIDGCIFVYPRQIGIALAGEITWNDRPLRAQTAQGERIALARSESIPAESSFTFDLLLLDPKLFQQVEEWLDYGALRGLGQWRNASYGRFEWQIVAEDVAISTHA